MNKTEKKCCYIHCNNRAEVLCERVEVKTVMPKRKELSKIQSKLLVAWRHNGEAEFHKSCWDSIFVILRKRSEKDPCLSKEEKKMIEVASEAEEFFDSETKIKAEARKVAEWIKTAKHLVTFTGAGISTSAGIGDYRGKAGKWTEEDQAGIQRPDSEEPATKRQKTGIQENLSDTEEEETDGVPYEKLRPTYTHEALSKLHNDGYLKFTVSQNGDGLHGLSGIPAGSLSELHGNVFIEYCEKCGKRFERDSYVMDDESSQYFEELEDHGKTTAKKRKHAKKCHLCGLSHRTGRKCDVKGCKGYLLDTIINFRDHLDETTLSRAEEACAASDVMLCLGTTLLVTPACDLVKNMPNRDRLVICNRQATPLDKQFSGRKPQGSRVFGDCDVFMREVMHSLYPVAEIRAWEAARGERKAAWDKLRAQC